MKKVSCCLPTTTPIYATAFNWQGRGVSVAEARYQQNLRTSFSDPSAKRELSIAQSELQLKAGEYDYAQELLNNTRGTAGASGLVIFADKDTWTGRPVTIGERIMRIADPSKVEVTINLAVADAIVLQEGASVELYLDSNPLQPVEAKLTSASFHAQPDGTGCSELSGSSRICPTGCSKPTTNRFAWHGQSVWRRSDARILSHAQTPLGDPAMDGLLKDHEEQDVPLPILRDDLEIVPNCGASQRCACVGHL